MDKLIFGSTALRHWFPDFAREPNDLDFIAKNGKSSPKIEYHWAPSFQYILDNNKDTEFVDADFLYTIKISHAAWDVRWEKTMKDINFMKSKGCKLDEVLYKSLLKDWEVIHSKKRIVLKGTPEEFFNSNVKRRYNHDDLHQIVKFYEQPMHTKIRRDQNDVKCDKNLWEVLSYEDKLKCALEEAYVFAIERYINLPPKIALSKALKQLITHSTKGYFNLFMIDNFFILLYHNSNDRFYKIHKGMKNG